MTKKSILGVSAVVLGLVAGCDSGDGGSQTSDPPATGGQPPGSGGTATGGAGTGGVSTGGANTGGVSTGGVSTGGVSTGGAGTAGAGATPGTGGTGALPPDEPLPPGPTAAVGVDDARQQIEGFGFSTAWGNVPPDDQMDAFFSVTTGAGFSIIRNRIPFRDNPVNSDGFVETDASDNYLTSVVNPGPNEYKTFSLNWNSWDLQATKRVIEAVQGNPDRELAAVFSTPWTPPNNDTTRWKLGVADYVNSPEVGGYLDPAHHVDYADLLADYVLEFEANLGVPLAALSIQNEPSYQVSYESCDWTAQQMKDFVTVLDQEFQKKGVYAAEPGLAIMAPELNNFSDDLIHPILDDPATAPIIGIAGAHIYEFGWAQPDPMTINFSPMTHSLDAGKRIWMTEWNAGRFGEGNTMEAVLAVAKSMDYLFSEASLNAYVYWWTSNLLTDDQANKTLWTMAQYSRFVRPGWHRVEADVSPATDVRLVAFANPDASQVAVVVTNLGNAEQTFNVQLAAGRFGDVTPYRTSSSEDMAVLPTIGGGNSWISADVPGESITTYVATVVR